MSKAQAEAQRAAALADKIEQCGLGHFYATVESQEYDDAEELIVKALREYAQIGLAQRIIDSADAQCFRWLLKHHSGTGKAIAGTGMRCWIGGVEFNGEDVRDAIDAAMERSSASDGPEPSPKR